MTAFRSRKLSVKRQHAANLRAPAPRQWQPATVTPPPLVLEWCAGHHDKYTPEESPPMFPVLSYMGERPWMTTFVLAQVFYVLALLTSATTRRWVAGSPEIVMLWVMMFGFVWLVRACTTASGDVLFCQIDLDGQQLVLHRPGAAARIKVVRLPFESITLIHPIRYSNSYLYPAGIDITYLDDQGKLDKVRVPEVLPPEVADAMMDALRPVLGQKVEETEYRDY